MWNSLADYYIRSGLFERARDVYEESIQTVTTVRDFTQVPNSQTHYLATEEKMKVYREKKIKRGRKKRKNCIKNGLKGLQVALFLVIISFTFSGGFRFAPPAASLYAGGKVERLGVIEMHNIYP